MGQKTVSGSLNVKNQDLGDTNQAQRLRGHFQEEFRLLVVCISFFTNEYSAPSPLKQPLK